MAVNRRLRRGFVLALALGFAATAAVLGYSFAAKTASSAPLAWNRTAASQARMLAGSGVSIAARMLLDPPSSVASCGYWTGTGAGGMSIDGSSDACVITVTRSAVDPRIFTVVSTGKAFDGAGTQRATSTVSADLVMPPPNKWCIPQAYLANGNQTLPSKVRFFGDAHVNGNLTGLLAWTQNGLSATGSIVWGIGLLFGPPSSITPSQAGKVMPTIKSSDYSTYSISGTSYSASSWNSDINYWNSIANGGAVTASNPGGVVICKSNIKLGAGLNFIGTLVCAGNLRLDGSATFQSVAGYPAFVVVGDLEVTTDNIDVTINGPVLVGGVMRKNNRNADIVINGTFISTGSIDSATTGSTLDLRWTSSGSTFYNFGGMTDKQPYTILRWSES